MREPLTGRDPVEGIESGLVDLSGCSFKDVVRPDGTPLDDTVLGHALRRILGDFEDPVAEFDSALPPRLG